MSATLFVLLCASVGVTDSTPPQPRYHTDLPGGECKLLATANLSAETSISLYTRSVDLTQLSKGTWQEKFPQPKCLAYWIEAKKGESTTLVWNSAQFFAALEPVPARDFKLAVRDDQRFALAYRGTPFVEFHEGDVKATAKPLFHEWSKPDPSAYPAGKNLRPLPYVVPVPILAATPELPAKDVVTLIGIEKDEVIRSLEWKNKAWNLTVRLRGRELLLQKPETSDEWIRPAEPTGSAAAAKLK